MLIALALAQAAVASEAGPKPLDAHAQILTELRATLKDPYSMIDLRICEPQPLKGWWVVYASFKSKNSYGGYGDTAGYAYQFVNGKRELAIEISADRASQCQIIDKAEIAGVFK